MPVATQAAIKGLTAQQMESLGVTLILNNTYHLNLRPGIKVLNEVGGAHKFQGWNRNLLTVTPEMFFSRNNTQPCRTVAAFNSFL
jgi:queuine tRNA-ribosyltransferase catalytic subunit